MTPRKIKVQNILGKTRIKPENNEDGKFQLFIWNSYSLQKFITKLSILSNHENIILFERYSRKNE